MQLKRFLSQSGMTFVEIMVALGLMGIVGIAGMKFMQETASNDSYLRFKAEVAKATAVIQTHLSDPNSCKSMLVNKTRNTNLAQLTMTNKLGTATVVLLRESTDYDGFRIPSGGIRLETSRYESGSNTVTDVVLTFEIRNRSFVNRTAGKMDTITKRIPVKTEISNTPSPNTIRSCGSVIADSNADAKKMLCDSLGSSVATWNGTDCLLKKFACPYGQVPSQMTSLGSFVCTPVENKVDVNQLFDWTSDPCSGTGTSVRLTTGAGGKIKAECL